MEEPKYARWVHYFNGLAARAGLALAAQRSVVKRRLSVRVYSVHIGPSLDQQLQDLSKKCSNNS